MTELPPVMFPPIQWKFKRLWEIPFASAVAAASHLTLVSDALTFPFQCLECKMWFDNDHINNVRYYFKHSRTRTRGTTLPPPDPNICARLGTHGYFVGNGLMRIARTNLKVTIVPAYLKVHVHNTNTFAIQANASIVIREL